MCPCHLFLKENLAQFSSESVLIVSTVACNKHYLESPAAVDWADLVIVCQLSCMQKTILSPFIMVSASG